MGILEFQRLEDEESSVFLDIALPHATMQEPLGEKLDGNFDGLYSARLRARVAFLFFHSALVFGGK